jgi:hypothetical protein
VPGKLDVGAGGDEARHARVPEVVEAVALPLEAGSTDGKSGTERTPDSVFGRRSSWRE